MTHFTEQQSRAGLIRGLRLVEQTARRRSLDSPFYSLIYGAFVDEAAKAHWQVKIEDQSPEITIRALSKINPKTDRVPYDFEKPIRVLSRNVIDFVAYGVLTYGRTVHASRTREAEPEVTDHLLFKSGNRAPGEPAYEGFSTGYDRGADQVYVHDGAQRTELFEAFAALSIKDAVETADYVRHVHTSPIREYL